MSLIDNQIEIEAESKYQEPIFTKSAKSPNFNFTNQNIQKKNPSKKQSKTNLIENYSSNEDDVINEIKEQPVFNTFEGKVTSLKKKLDEIDEKRIRDSMNLKDNRKKSVKIKKKPEKSKLQLPKLPKNPKKDFLSTFEINKIPSKNPPNPEKAFKGRSIFGSVKFKLISTKTSPKGHHSVRNLNTSKLDLKYNSGETLRLLKKSISSNYLAISSSIAPFTENLEALNRKKNILTSLSVEPSQKIPSKPINPQKD